MGTLVSFGMGGWFVLEAKPPLQYLGYLFIVSGFALVGRGFSLIGKRAKVVRQPKPVVDPGFSGLGKELVVWIIGIGVVVGAISYLRGQGVL